MGIKKLLLGTALLLSTGVFAQKFISDSMLVSRDNHNTAYASNTQFDFYKRSDTMYLDISMNNNISSIYVNKILSSKTLPDSCFIVNFLVTNQLGKSLVLSLLYTMDTRLLGVGVSSREQTVLFKINLENKL